MRHTAIGLALVSLLTLPLASANAAKPSRHALPAVGGVTVASPADQTINSMFWLDTPADNATVAGAVEVKGWIVDPRGISNIDLYVDGVYTASADLNEPRYDVVQAYPWLSATINARPGFSTSFNAASLTDGAHTIFVRVRFANGDQEDFGTRTVIVDKSLNQPPFGEIDMPGPAQPMNGVFPVTGWALDDSKVTKVEVLIDGQTIGGANMGMPRPDVHNRFPAVPGSADAGFVRMVNTTTFPNGVHTLAVRLWDDEGASRVIGQRFVQIFNNGRNLPPFGRIEWPIANHYVYITGCANGGAGWSGPSFHDTSEWMIVSGWALDVGSRTDPGRVAWLELYIDGSGPLLSTKTDEVYAPSPFNLDMNYYGIERPDILKLFPDVPNAKDSGFRFAVNVKDLMFNHGFNEGLHYVTVRAGDVAGYTANIATIPVIFDCDNDPDVPAFGDIYTPANMERVSGTYEVTGWATDSMGSVQDVQVLVDGDLMGLATYGTPSPEVHQNFPWIPFNVNSVGYTYDLDTTKLTDGQHTLVIRAVDYWGGTNYIGQRTFVVDNENSGQ